MTHDNIEAIADAIEALRDMVAQATKPTTKGYWQQHVKIGTLKEAIAALEAMDGDS